MEIPTWFALWANYWYCVLNSSKAKQDVLPSILLIGVYSNKDLRNTRCHRAKLLSHFKSRKIPLPGTAHSPLPLRISQLPTVVPTTTTTSQGTNYSPLGIPIEQYSVYVRIRVSKITSEHEITLTMHLREVRDSISLVVISFIWFIVADSSKIDSQTISRRDLWSIGRLVCMSSSRTRIPIHRTACDNRVNKSRLLATQGPSTNADWSSSKLLNRDKTRPWKISRLPERYLSSTGKLRDNVRFETRDPHTDTHVDSTHARKHEWNQARRRMLSY